MRPCRRVQVGRRAGLFTWFQGPKLPLYNDGMQCMSEFFIGMWGGISLDGDDELVFE
jgi:hypothetical protein